MTIYDIPAEWHDLESARDQWDDAPFSDERLTALLDVARSRVVRWAAWQPAANAVPSHFREAQLRVAINLWNAEKSDQAAADGDFPFQARLLEWKTLIPKGRLHVR